MTFENAGNIFDECVGKLIITDQGVPVKKIGVSKRRKREKMISNVTLVTHVEAMMGLQAVHEVERLNEANRAMSTCRQQQHCFTTLRMNISSDECFEEIPLQYSIDNANIFNHTGWMNVQDNVIYNSGLHTDCRMVDQVFVNIKATEYMYSATNGKLTSHTSVTGY